MSKKIKIISIVGARPNFMKIAPFIAAIEKYNSQNGHKIEHLLVHTGQHYDVAMSESFFRDLQIPAPDVNLEVGSGSHARQTAEVMIRFEKVCNEHNPDWVVVVGDVNSTVACTLVSAKLQIKVAHIEAGLRSFDRTMPEEINRLVTDALADLLFTPSEDADNNLLREGVHPEKIKRVGNIMIDTLVRNLEKARALKPYAMHGCRENEYIFVTLHRPSNVDDKEALEKIIKKLAELSKSIPVIFPIHPRTEKNLTNFGIMPDLKENSGLKLCPPVGYFESIGLADKARFVLTDSGGLQEETTYLKVPCLTLRPNTERPVTITIGTNKLTSLDNLESDIKQYFSGEKKKGNIPDLWDGSTSTRIVNVLIQESR